MLEPVSVLLVESDGRVRQALGEALEIESYAVALASTGGDAVCHLRLRRDVDAVVLDVPHGATCGWHVVDRLRKLKPTLPIIVLTTTRNRNNARCPRLGVTLLEKPVDMPLFFKTLRDITAQ